MTFLKKVNISSHSILKATYLLINMGRNLLSEKNHSFLSSSIFWIFVSFLNASYVRLDGLSINCHNNSTSDSMKLIDQSADWLLLYWHCNIDHHRILLFFFFFLPFVKFESVAFFSQENINKRIPVINLRKTKRRHSLKQIDVHFDVWSGDGYECWMLILDEKKGI